MSPKQFHQNLHSIFLATPDTTLITSDGQHVLTQQLLLAAVSPFLASLLAQAGPFSAAISLPFESHVVRHVLGKLGSMDAGADEIEGYAFGMASDLGIDCLKEKKSDLNYFSSAEEFVFDENPKMMPTLLTSNAIKNEPGPGKEVKLKKEVVPKAVDTQCNSCEISFKSQNEFKLHKKNTHIETGKTSCICDQCGKSFATARTRNLHIETTHSEKNPYACKQCGKSMSSPGNLVAHIQNQHTEGPLLPCPQCGKQVKGLEAHIKQVHVVSDEKFPCEECGKIFRTKKDVTTHMRYHAPDDVRIAMKEKAMEKNKCKFCGKGFIDSTRLKWHEASRHTGVKNFHCKQCDKSFFRSDHLRTHMTSVHVY